MWLFLGLALGAVLLVLVVWLRSRKIAVAWYEWLLGGLGLALVLFALQNYMASVAALEPTAPGMFLLVFGLPGIVLLLLAIFLAWWRHARSGRSARNEASQTAASGQQA